VDFSRALTTITDMLNGTIAALPNILLAFIIFMLFYFVAKRTRGLVSHMTEKRQKARNLGLILGKLAQSAVVTAGLLVTLTILFPSFKPGDLIQLLGIGSVAIGFAFHDLFQNFLAGILLLLTAPFRIGDQIVVQQFEGTVEDIAMRATTIQTYDGRRVVIPNTDLFTNSVTVNTAFDMRRLEYEIGISYEDDIATTKDIILETLADIDDVLSVPAPEALVVALAESAVTMRVSWWTNAHRQASILHLQDRALTALKNRLLANGVSFPFPTQQVLIQRLPDKNHERSPDVAVGGRS
jgi:small conductance mechanosensitive channel